MINKVLISVLLAGSMLPTGGVNIHYEEDGEYYGGEYIDETYGHVITPDESARILEIVALGYNPYIAPEDDYSYGTPNNPGYWDETGQFVPQPQQAEPVYSGYIKIGPYYATLQSGSDQWIVDQEGVAATWNENGKTLIADHAHQGFKAFRWNDTAEINGVFYKKVSQYNGYNDDYYIRLNDGTICSELNDGDVITYTCADTAGTNVVIAYWSPVGYAPESGTESAENNRAPKTDSYGTQGAGVAAVEAKAPPKEMTEKQKEHALEKVLTLYETH